MDDVPYARPEMAAVYDRIAAPYLFAQPAHDLVTLVNPHEGEVVLDVGTGTGVVAAAAQKAVGGRGLVIGTDAAIEMIRFARKETAHLVAARAPGLPFPAEIFDAVVAGFVASHFENYIDGLKEMIRVCRTGGRLGISAWGSLPNPVATLWSDTAARYVPRNQLEEGFRSHIPWDTWFSQTENVRRALETAGLSSVVTKTHVYSVRMPTSDFLTSREASMQGLILRRTLTPVEWEDFRLRVRETLETAFGQTLEYRRDVNFGTGTKSD